MHNCYKLFVNGYLILVTSTESNAEAIAELMNSQGEIVYKIEPAFIENIGF